MSSMTDSSSSGSGEGLFKTGSSFGQPPVREAEPDLEGAFAEDGVDLTLIRWMLGLSPIERLQAAQDLIDSTWTVRTGSET